MGVESDPSGGSAAGAGSGEGGQPAGCRDEGHFDGEHAGALALDVKVCPRCAEDVKRAAVVCRYCGHEFDDPAVNAPSTWSQTGRTPASPRRGAYRGSRRLMLGGVVALLMGLPMSIGAFFLMQSEGPLGDVFSFGVPAVNAGLEALGTKKISVSSGSHVSTLLVLLFVAGVFLVIVGVCLLIWGTGRTVAAFSPRARALSERARPVASNAARHGARGVSSVTERGHQGLEHARPRLAQAARKGKRTITDDVMPVVSAGADRGREQWKETVPRVGAAALRGKDWLRRGGWRNDLSPAAADRHAGPTEPASPSAAGFDQLDAGDDAKPPGTPAPREDGDSGGPLAMS
jgi:Uncharacterised protein family UPF0547